jgi:hypothetical protein
MCVECIAHGLLPGGLVINIIIIAHRRYTIHTPINALYQALSVEVSSHGFF